MAADEEAAGCGLLAVDLGGTWLRATTPRAGISKALRYRVSAITTAEEIVGTLWDSARAQYDGKLEAVSKIVLAVPTFFDGVHLLDCPAIPALSGVPLAEMIVEGWHRETGVEMNRAPTVKVIPDLAAAALGESRLGAGRDVERFLCVALGTGANAAAVVRGRLLDSAFGCLGDAGHVVVEPEGLPCSCGGRGCLESRVSGWALTRDARALGFNDPPELFAAAAAGHPEAAQTIDAAGRLLGCAMATWSAMLWPQVIAVAGGLSAAGEALLSPARAALARHGAPYIINRLRVVRSDLGADATLAGCLVME